MCSSDLLKKGRAATMTHDYKRNDTTTLFAVLNGEVIAQCQKRHRHTEWLTFLKQVDRETPTGKTLHLIADNYATHKHPVVQRWLDKHPRFHMHFTPTSASWLNMVERFFRDITENTSPKPFIWTKSARDILQKVIRANRKLSAKQNEALHYFFALATW